MCASARIFPFISKGQDDFTDVLAALHAGVGGSGVLELEGRIDHRLYRFGGNQLHHLGFDCLGNHRFIGDRAGAQRRPRMHEPFEHQATKIDVGAERSLKCDLHDAAFDRGRIVVAIDVFATDQVENDVGAAFTGRCFGRDDEIFVFVVNGDIGTKFDAGRAFFRRSGGGDDRPACGW